MGDRGNIVIRQEAATSRGDVWLYAHWTGYQISEVVARALARQERWDDPPYLARIIFCELVKGDESGATGFGISTSIGANEHPIVVVDVPGQRVMTVTENRLVDYRLPDSLAPFAGEPFSGVLKVEQK